AGAEQLVADGIVRETALRVINYWLSRLSQSETLQQMEFLQREKIKQVDKMRKLVNLKSCIREYIIECFDQHLKGKPENCCVNDDNDYNVFGKRQEKAQKVVLESWQNRLNALLP